MHSKFFSLSASIAFGLTLSFSSQAQDAKTLHYEALKKDAEFVSRATGESYENTLRQLQLESDIAEQKIPIKLREEFKERLTGISIDHKKGSRLLVLLKGDEKVPERILQINGNALLVDFRSGYSHTNAELKTIFLSKSKELNEAFPGLDGLFADEQTGEIVLQILKDDSNSIESMRMRAKEILGAPVRIDAVASPMVLQARPL